MSKGDRYRLVNKKRYDKNYERIFRMHSQLREVDSEIKQIEALIKQREVHFIDRLIQESKKHKIRGRNSVPKSHVFKRGFPRKIQID